MIDGKRLLTDLQPLLRRLQSDLLDRSVADAELGTRLRDEWQLARSRERTAQTFEAWREDVIAQAVVMWILACVFVRLLEDNDLVSPPRLAGPGDRLRLARDQHTLYFQQHPLESDRDYLHDVFAAVAELPGAGPLFDRRHNPVWTTGISGDAAAAVLEFWQRVDPETGALVHDFTDPDWSTRFLGDLYQDLSESARKKYALLQTPDFVLQFILDRTLTPGIDEFGFREVTVIDPACGSGHFLLASFERLFALWTRHEPGTNPRELSQRALRQVAGVDLNPFAVAIARFRLLLAALRACGIKRLADAPAFAMELAAGDSLLHGPRPNDGERQMYLDPAQDPISHVYETEDAEDLRRILGRSYHVVVGNPPYITPKDAALNKAYRERFGSCHRTYSLGVPFTERFFDLALSAPPESKRPAGFVGMITANSFMKREFGKELIETYLPKWDLTHVIDTSGAYIPGHGTPTVVLLGRNRAPGNSEVRAVLGIRGEPAVPEDPARGSVWTAIQTLVDRPGAASQFVTVVDLQRPSLSRHPWSLGGGGAAELRTHLESSTVVKLTDVVASVGFYQDTHADEAFVQPVGFARRRDMQAAFRPHVRGDEIRDWSAAGVEEILFPFRDDLVIWSDCPRRPAFAWFYALRTSLWARSTFGGGTYRSEGRPWFDYHQFPRERARTPLSLAFAFVATHNHFVLDRGGKVFNRSAPVIKLPPGATEDDHLRLLGLLNSSTACFWMKQVMHNKGSTVDERGARQRTMPFEDFFEFTGTALLRFPVPVGDVLPLTRDLDLAASASAELVPRNLAELLSSDRRSLWESSLRRMMSDQEELDWLCYRHYGVTDASGLECEGTPPPIDRGCRAFEIVMARKMAASELETTWFERHGSTPVTEIPSHWPKWYQDVVERRIAEIESNPQVALIEQPEYKRRWNVEPWDEQVQRAQREWLLDRLESADYWPEVALTGVARLADRARQDQDFMRVAALYRGQDTFDVGALVAELVADETVPFLPTQRYKPSGVRKREVWEQTWALQRQEDAIDARVALPEGHQERLTVEEAAAKKQREVGDIPVPPKYKSSDFRRSSYWKLRGKLDVPKERFISYPGCEREADPTLVIGWAGWDYLQQARALATFYVQMKESEGWTAERLKPLLAGLQELLPWVKQWHNEVNPEFGVAMGDYFEGFLDEELRGFGFTKGDLDIRL